MKSSDSSIDGVPGRDHPPIPCRSCGAIDTPTIGPGKGPHWASARCKHCHRFITWLSQKSPDIRAAQRAEGRRQAMAGKPPTELQMTYLKALGHTGSQPQTMLAASEAIDQYKRDKGEQG